MNIMLVNDDGIDSPGIRELARAFHVGHQVTVVAPDGQRSGFSQSVTYDQTLVVKKKDLGLSGVSAYTVSGTPADCCKLGIFELCQEKPDLVVSGINIGYNLGHDIHYSGTFAAAAEAFFFGIPSIACSLCPKDHWNFAYGADFIRQFVDQTFPHLSKNCVININFPDMKDALPKGIRVTLSSQMDYCHTFAFEQKGEECHYKPIWTFFEQSHTADAKAAVEGYITITPMQPTHADEACLAQWKEHPEWFNLQIEKE